MRYFRSTDSVYEQARAGLDAEWGLPNDKGTTTCIEPVATAPRDSQGRIVLAVSNEFLAYPAATQMLEYMIGIGDVTEISASDYHAVVNQAP